MKRIAWVAGLLMTATVALAQEGFHGEFVDTFDGAEPTYFSGIPTNRTRYRLNFWHTNNWPVDTNPRSIEAPRYPYEVEIDWMEYKPMSK